MKETEMADKQAAAPAMELDEAQLDQAAGGFASKRRGSRLGRRTGDCHECHSHD
jgi:hypothetical protein